MRLTGHVAGLLVAVIAGRGAAYAADFRLVAQTDTLATVIDADAIEVSGDVRVATFYTATTEANIFGRTRLQFDCAGRRMRPESMLGIDPMTGKAGREKIMTDDWSLSDRTVSDSRTTKLVCGTPETRDTYARRLPQTDWRSALLAAFEPLRGAFALAFDLPVGSKELLCTGGTVVRSESAPPTPTSGGFRIEVDTERRTLLSRDALGPGIPSDYRLTSVTGAGVDLGLRAAAPGSAEGRLDFKTKALHIDGRHDLVAEGTYVVDLHCSAAHPLPLSAASQ